MTIVRLDSSQRNTTVYSNNNYWVYNLASSLFNISKVRLKNVSIYNSMYVVNQYNYGLQIIDSTGPTTYNLTLPSKNYTAAQLATQLQTSLNAYGGTATFTVTADLQTMKFTITSSRNFIFNWSVNALNAKLLGFNATNSTNTTSFVSDNVFYVNTTRCYYLYIPEITNSAWYPYKATYVLENNTNPGALLTYFENDYKIEYDLGQNPILVLNQLSIYLYDEFYNLVLLNNIDYSITLEFL